MVIKRWQEMLSPSRLDQAASIKDVMLRCGAKTYDLVLLHRSILDIASFTALRKAFSRLRFFLLSDQPSEDEGLDFLKAGIAGYGNTYISKERLTEAVRIISDGGVWLGQRIIQRLIIDTAARQTRLTEADKALDGLTRMERKIAYMVSQGLTNLEIANELKITERTVKAHLTSVYGKTKTGNRLALALLVNRQNH